jgi:hypothetical protein
MNGYASLLPSPPPITSWSGQETFYPFFFLQISFKPCGFEHGDYYNAKPNCLSPLHGPGWPHFLLNAAIRIIITARLLSLVMCT